MGGVQRKKTGCEEGHDLRFLRWDAVEANGREIGKDGRRLQERDEIIRELTERLARVETRAETAVEQEKDASPKEAWTDIMKKEVSVHSMKKEVKEIEEKRRRSDLLVVTGVKDTRKEEDEKLVKKLCRVVGVDATKIKNGKIQ